jgi:hypothetical protein
MKTQLLFVSAIVLAMFADLSVAETAEPKAVPAKPAVVAPAKPAEVAAPAADAAKTLKPGETVAPVDVSKDPKTLDAAALTAKETVLAPKEAKPVETGKLHKAVEAHKKHAK